MQLIKGENISSLPVFGPLADRIEAPVALVVGDDVSTDEILPAGARVLPYRSNIPKSFPPIARSSGCRKESGGTGTTRRAEQRAVM